MNSAGSKVAATMQDRLEIAPRPFGVMKTSLQFVHLSAAPNSFSCWRSGEAGMAEKAQQQELMSSMATWPPGAMQSTDAELGKSIASAAKTTATLPDRLDIAKLPRIAATDSANDMDHHLP
jgi:hypothetical protein